MKNLHLVNAVVFALIALAHLYRLFAGTPVSFGSTEVPLWASGVAVVVAAVLAWLNGAAAKK